MGKNPGKTPDKDLGKPAGRPRPPVRGRHLPGSARIRNKVTAEERTPDARAQESAGENRRADSRGPRPVESRPRGGASAPASGQRREYGSRREHERTHEGTHEGARKEDASDPGNAPRRRPVPKDGGMAVPRPFREEAHHAPRPERPHASPRDAQQAPRSRERSAPSGYEEQHFFVPCPKGLENELVAELAEIGIEGARPAAGGAAFRGPLHLAWKANLWSRLAVRVLWRVGEGPYQLESDLYDGALKIDWPALFEVSRTFAVHAIARNSPLKSLNFSALKVKDAVCDRFRQVCGERPNVETHGPDVPLVLYLTDARYSLYVDLSGEPLNRRGFRVEPAVAPLNENLAAGLLRLSGWRPGTAFFDPMMGGGTLLIEAAMMWLNRAPGLKRHFAFENLKSFDHIAWQRLRKNAEGEAHDPESLPIFGSDIDADMVRASGLNLQAAELFDCVNLLESDCLEVEAPPVEPGVIISNPPYGVRLSLEDMAAFYHGIGDVLKKRFSGWTAYFISADEQFPKSIGLSASRRTPLYNGPLECRFYEYRLVAGSNRKPRADEG